ncbi:MFS transporter [Ornithinibacillus halotolerans]|uniref:MFS-type transporter YfnC n=1 Tax=Ornithinibacillus halotolerans TaxID=1274357 RepID=A0A916WCB8_9BACI|nr:MFS transporter [Ornithinibacillus halotolerans]GGA86779.1 putative MFS-type transporter YfnC [Ornithinibacillus halotolerans]
MDKALQNKSLVTPSDNQTTYRVLFIIAGCHLLNDSLQAVIPAMFPILERSMGLSFTQLGLIAFALNMVSSVMQPVVGTYTDKRPIPYALPIGLTSSMFGILGLALAPNFWFVLISVVFIGLGSAVFHPEGSRVVYLAAGDKRGLAQSIFQVGGNSGQALAPVITALILVPLGQKGALWFTLIAGLAVIFLTYIARWYKGQMELIARQKKNIVSKKPNIDIAKSIKIAIVLLVFIVFARSWYAAAISNFYAFYAIDTYQISIANSQIYIFIFLAMGAVGTFIGGPLADRFGRKNIILLSLIAVSPLSVLLPFVGSVFAMVLLAIIGIILMTSFSVTVVYAQELIPGKIGLMSGLIVGLAFGMGAIGAVALGVFIDLFGLSTTMIMASLLPLLGFLALLLPSDKRVQGWYN